MLLIDASLSIQKEGWKASLDFVINMIRRIEETGKERFKLHLDPDPSNGDQSRSINEFSSSVRIALAYFASDPAIWYVLFTIRICHPQQCLIWSDIIITIIKV